MLDIQNTGPPSIIGEATQACVVTCRTFEQDAPQNLREKMKSSSWKRGKSRSPVYPGFSRKCFSLFKPLDCFNNIVAFCNAAYFWASCLEDPPISCT